MSSLKFEPILSNFERNPLFNVFEQILRTFTYIGVDFQNNLSFKHLNNVDPKQVTKIFLKFTFVGSGDISKENSKPICCTIAILSLLHTIGLYIKCLDNCLRTTNII